LKGQEAGLRIGTVHLGKIEVGKVGHQAGDIAAGHTHLDRRTDGVSVVLHAENYGQLLV
jgi:hypothetical protein